MVALEELDHDFIWMVITELFFSRKIFLKTIRGFWFFNTTVTANICAKLKASHINSTMGKNRKCTDNEQNKFSSGKPFRFLSVTRSWIKLCQNVITTLIRQAHEGFKQLAPNVCLSNEINTWSP